ncbi:MAG: DUF1367 family protein [Gammaproteobacteria bacterium]|nr:DUF1367 family protein [Gammaproteobacteria bacterium]
MKVFLQKRTIKHLDCHGELVDLVVMVPHDEATIKYISRRTDGQVLVTDLKQARSYENHKRFFDFLGATFAMQEFYTELEQYRRWITVAAGWFDIMVYPDGATQLNPKSIAFENMEEDEFRKLFTAAIGAFIEAFGNGMTDSELMRIISYD